MKKICTFLLILVAVFLVGCAKTPGTEVFRFEVRELKLTVGDQKQLDLILGSHEGEAVVFEILNNSTAVEIVEEYADAVVIKAVEAGEASFKAMLKDANNVNDVIVISVSNPKSNLIQVLPEGNPTTIVYMGETLQLTAVASSLTDGYTPNWVFETSNKRIASVDENGLVTSVGVGTVYITVYDENDPEFVVKKTINVSYRPTSYIEIPEKTVNIKSGEVYKISAVAYDAEGSSENASQTFTYKSSRTNVASVNAEGQITGIGSGSSVITIESYNAITATTVTTKVTVNVTYRTEIERDSITLAVGDSDTLTKYFWVKDLEGSIVSGDEGVISFVNNSPKRIKAEKVGSVVLNLTAGDVSKEVTINVVECVSSSEVLSKSTAKLTWTALEETDMQHKFTLTLNDANGALDYEVSSSNENIVKIEKSEEGLVLTVFVEGIVTIKLTSGDFVKETLLTIE